MGDWLSSAFNDWWAIHRFEVVCATTMLVILIPGYFVMRFFEDR